MHNPDVPERVRVRRMSGGSSHANGAAMAESEVFDAPVLKLNREPRTKWERELREFERMLPELLTTWRGMYVAVHEGRVVATGDHMIDVAMEAHSRCGYVPLHVGLVTEQPPPPVRIETPRIIRGPSAR